MEEKTSNYKTRRDYVNKLASDNKFNATLSDKPANSVFIKNIPQSMEEAISASNFWGDVLDEFHKDVSKIDFFYGEKSGDIKYDGVNPQAILVVDKSKSLLKLITQEEEWKRLKKVSQITDTFDVPFALLPKNLCYHVNIPLECINGVTFNQEDFLNQEYKDPKEKESNSGTSTGKGVFI